MEWRRGDHVVSDEPARIDRERVWRYLARESYWAAGIPQQAVDKAIEHSLCFGLYREGAQVGFARVVTDRSTFAYLCDVFVLPEYRGNGYAHALLTQLFASESLQGLRRIMLATTDAHHVYRPHGFKALSNPALFMEVHDPDVYGST